MKRIAVLTSGGDAPGMNAAIRAIVRMAAARRGDVWGIEQGCGIIQQGGTILGSARCRAFCEPEGRREAIRELNLLGIDALIVIGGNGSQTGAHALFEMGFPVVGVASTIDNDLCGSDVTIGADTALNVALEAIDRLKVTASAHERAIFLEVMGRDCGYLALMAGIAGGAEAVVCPEFPRDPQEVADIVRHAYDAGKTHALVVVAEGAPYNAAKLADYFRENRAELGFEVRVTILGYVQRGGTPSAFDRILGTRLGAAAVECLERGEHGVLVGHICGATTTTPLKQVAGHQKPLDPEVMVLADVLAR
jgi:6-phosphofructokinase 1